LKDREQRTEQIMIEVASSPSGRRWLGTPRRMRVGSRYRGFGPSPFALTCHPHLSGIPDILSQREKWGIRKEKRYVQAKHTERNVVESEKSAKESDTAGSHTLVEITEQGI